MTDLEDKLPKLEVEAWERRRLRIRQHYIARGMSEEEADDQATANVCREIRRASWLGAGPSKP